MSAGNYDGVTARMGAEHWALVGVLKDAYGLSGEELEAFLCCADTLPALSSFIASAEATATLFVHRQRTPSTSTSTSGGGSLQISAEPPATVQGKCVFFATPSLRTAAGADGSPAAPAPSAAPFSQRLVWGELDSELLGDLREALHLVCIPAIDAQRRFGACPREQVDQFMAAVRRFAGGLPAARGPSGGILARPGPEHGVSPAASKAVRNDVLPLHERLAEGWLEAIEGLVGEACCLHDLDAFPDAAHEINFWTHRLGALDALTNQLKRNEYQAVIGSLIAGQSRLVRRWKAADTAVTEAHNEARDFVAYLASLAPLLAAATGPGSSLAALQAEAVALTQPTKLSNTIVRHPHAAFFLSNLFRRVALHAAACSAQGLQSEAGTPRWATPSTPGLVPDIQAASRLLQSVAQGMTQSFHRISQHQQQMTQHQTALTATTSSTSTSTAQSGRAVTRRQSRMSLALVEPDFDQLKAVVAPLQGLADRLDRMVSVLDALEHFLALAKHLAGVSASARGEHLAATVQRIRLFLCQEPSCLDDVACTGPAAVDKALDAVDHAIEDEEENQRRLISELLDGMASGTEALELLGRFEVLKKRPTMKRSFEDAFITCFGVYESQLEQVQVLYEDEKAHPCLSRNAPVVSGSIRWVQQLQQRVEGPMNTFKLDQTLIASPSGLRVTKLFNKIYEALLKFESLWMVQWRSGISSAKTALQAPLLRLDGSRSFALNLDPSVKTLLEETKQLQGMGISVPKSAVSALKQEPRIKLFDARLTELLSRHAAIQDRIPHEFRALFQPLLGSVRAQFHPGTLSLTWESTNIDVYAHNVNRSMDALEEALERVMVLVAGVTEQLGALALHPFLALEPEEPLPLDEFVRAQDASLGRARERSQELLSAVLHLAEDVQEAVGPADQEELARTATFKRTATTTGSSPTRPPRRPSTRTTPKATIATTAAGLAAFTQHMVQEYTRCVSAACEASLDRLAACVSPSATRPVVQAVVEFGTPNNCLQPGVGALAASLHQAAQRLQDLHRSLVGTAPSNLDTPPAGAADLAISDGRAETIEGKVAALRPLVEQQLGQTLSFDAVCAELAADPSLSVAVSVDARVEQLSGLAETSQRALARIEESPNSTRVGGLMLSLAPLKNALSSELAACKTRHAEQFHALAKADLDRTTGFVQEMNDKLSAPVESLEDLVQIMGVLHDIEGFLAAADTTPLETQYELLVGMGAAVPRGEKARVDSLHQESLDLLSRANGIRRRLTTAERARFERLLDVHAKSLMVATIHLRNSFDKGGPRSEGISALAALHRLRRLSALHGDLQAQREVLVRTEAMFSLPETQYRELDATGEHLARLAQLYDLYEDFLGFKTSFEGTLWADLDLGGAEARVAELRARVCALECNLTRWPAHHEMADILEAYTQVLPLLGVLSGAAIRDRHWRELMTATGVNFRVEALDVATLLSLNLPQVASKVYELARGAAHEATLEATLSRTEADWNEHVFSFEDCRRTNTALASRRHTQRLVDKAENTRMDMSVMAGSPSLGAHRAELVAWMAKLTEIAQFLTRLLDVQGLWHRLRLAFELHPALGPEEAAFGPVDRDFTRFVSQAMECGNIMQFAYGYESDVPKIAVLDNLAERLELNQKSLSDFLAAKRLRCPRLFPVSDSDLLGYLGANVDAARPSPAWLPVVFAGVERLAFSPKKRRHVTGLVAGGGETLALQQPVEATPDLVGWLTTLLAAARDAVRAAVSRAMGASPRPALNGDLSAPPYFGEVTQVAVLALRGHWTADFVAAIERVRDYRTSVRDAARTYTELSTKLAGLVRRYTRDAVRLRRAEALVLLAQHLRDLGDEVHASRCQSTREFAWRRHIRVEYDAAEGGARVHLALDGPHPFDCEFLGQGQRLFLTPQTERMLLHLCTGASTRATVIQDPDGAGRAALGTLAGLLGRHLTEFSCSPATRLSSLVDHIRSLSHEGAWGYFPGLMALPVSTLSVVAETLGTLAAARREQSAAGAGGRGGPAPAAARASSLSFAVFTSVPGQEGRAAVPPEVSERFREVALVAPSLAVLVRAHIIASGLSRNADDVAAKALRAIQLGADLFPSRPWYGFDAAGLLAVIATARSRVAGPPPAPGSGSLGGRRRSVPNNITAPAAASSSTGGARAPPAAPGGRRLTLASVDGLSMSPRPPAGLSRRLSSSSGDRLEWSILAGAFCRVFLPRMEADDAAVFVDMLASVLGADPAPLECARLHFPAAGPAGLPAAVRKYAGRTNLTCTDELVQAVVRLERLTRAGRGCLVVGGPGTGKTTLVSCLVNALAQVDPGKSHRLLRLNLGAASAEELLGRPAEDGGGWQDGFLSTVVRQAAQSAELTSSVFWVLLDGPIMAEHRALVASLVNDTGLISLPNGDRLRVPANLRFILESTAGEASHGWPSLPALLVPPALLTWRALTDPWLHTRRGPEAAALGALFDRTLPSVLKHVANEVPPACRVPMPGQVQTLLALLNGLLEESVQSATLLAPTHLECVVLFALTWAVGGALARPQQRRAFHSHLKTLSTIVPEDEPGHTVFDYQLTAGADWVPWAAVAHAVATSGEPVLHARGFVETKASACLHFLVALLAGQGRSLVVLGDMGAGKLAALQHFHASRQRDTHCSRYLPCSRLTAPADIKAFLACSTVQRSGQMYGAAGGKPLNLVLAGAGHLGDGLALETVRQLFDGNKWFSPSTASGGPGGEWRYVADVALVATVQASPSYPPAMQRLLGHSAVFALAAPDDVDVERVLGVLLDDRFDIEGSSAELLGAARQLARPTAAAIRRLREELPPEPGQWYCSYGLGHAKAVAACITRIPLDVGPIELLTAWRHALETVFGARLPAPLRARVGAICKAILVEHLGVVAEPRPRSLMEVLEDHLAGMHLRLRDFFQSCDRKRAGAISGPALQQGLKGIGAPLSTAQQQELVDLVGGAGGDGDAPAITLAALLEARAASVALARDKRRATSKKKPPSTGRSRRASAIESQQQQQQQQQPAGGDGRGPSPSAGGGMAVGGGIPYDSLRRVVVDMVRPRSAPAPILSAEDAELRLVSPHLWTPGVVAFVDRFTDTAGDVATHVEALNEARASPLLVTDSLLRTLLGVTSALNVVDGHSLLITEGHPDAHALLELAAGMADFDLSRLQTAGAFSGSMRAAFRQAGSKNRKAMVVVDLAALPGAQLERLGGFLACGLIFDLFTDSERTALHDGLRDEVGAEVDAAELFRLRIASNLHLVLLAPSEAALQRVVALCPSLLARCRLDRLPPLGEAVLSERATAFLRHDPLLRNLPPARMHRVAATLAQAHSVATEVARTGGSRANARPWDSFHLFLGVFRDVYARRRSSLLARHKTVQDALRTCDANGQHINELSMLGHEAAANIKRTQAALDKALAGLCLAAADEAQARGGDGRLNRGLEPAEEGGDGGDEDASGGGAESDDDEEMLSTFVNTFSPTKRAGRGGAGAGAGAVGPAEAPLQRTLEELLAWQAKITLKRIDALRVMHSPPALVRRVMDMVAVVLHKPLLTDIFTRRGHSVFVDSWPQTQHYLMDPRFIDHLQSYRPEHMDAETLELLETYTTMPGMSTSAIRRASKDALVLWEWIQRLVAYHTLATAPQPPEREHSGVGAGLGPGDDAANGAAVPEGSSAVEGNGDGSGNHQAADSRDDGADGDGAPGPASAASRIANGLTASTLQLHEEYDRLLLELQGHEREQADLRQRTKVARQLEASFGEHLGAWKTDMLEMKSAKAQMLPQSILAAGYVFYGSHLREAGRARVQRELERLCRANLAAAGREPAQHRLFSSLPLFTFWFDKVAPVAGGPVAAHDPAAASFVADDAAVLDIITAAGLIPLIVSRAGQGDTAAAGALEALATRAPTAALEYAGLEARAAEVEDCVAHGGVLLVRGVDPDTVGSHPVLEHLVAHNWYYNSRQVKTVDVCGQPTEYHDGFQLVLVTVRSDFAVSADLARHVRPVCAETRSGPLVDMLTARSLLLEHPALYTRVAELRAEKHRLRCATTALEGQTLGLLAAAATPASAHPTAAGTGGEAAAGEASGASPGAGQDQSGWATRVVAIQKEHAETVELSSEVEEQLRRTVEATVAARGLAARIAPLLLALLHFPAGADGGGTGDDALALGLGILDHCLLARKDDPAAGSARGLVSGFAHQLHDALASGVSAAARRLLAATLALALADAPPPVYAWLALLARSCLPDSGPGRVDEVSRDPSDLHILDGAAALGRDMPACFSVLEPHLDAIAAAKADLVVWRAASGPEASELPGGLHKRLSALQRLVLAATLCPHRLGALVDAFVDACAGFRAVNLPWDAARFRDTAAAAAGPAAEATSRVCLVVSASGELVGDSPALVAALAAQQAPSPVPVETLLLHSGLSAPAAIARLHAAAKNGVWLVACGGNADLQLTAALVREAHAMHGDEVLAPFRLWLLGRSDALLRFGRATGVPTVVRSPRVRFAERLAACIKSIPSGILTGSLKPEWLPVLHNACLLHCVLDERHRFGGAGWSRRYPWANSDLQAVVAFAREQFRSGYQLRLSAIRVFAELQYSRVMASRPDRRALSLLVGMYLSGAALREGATFGAGPGAYQLPGVFFRRTQSQSTNHVLEMSAVLKGLEAGFPEDGVPGLCGLAGEAWAAASSREAAALLRACEDQAVVLDATGGAIRVAGGPAGGPGGGAALSGPEQQRQPAPPKMVSSKPGSRRGSVRRASSRASLTTVGGIAGGGGGGSRGGGGGVSPPGAPADACLAAVQRVLRQLPTRVNRVERRLAALSASACQRAFLGTEAQLLNAWLQVARARFAELGAFLQGQRALAPHDAADLADLSGGHVPRSLGVGQPAAAAPLAGWVEALVRQHKAVDGMLTSGLRVPSVPLGVFAHPRALLAVLECEALQTPDRTVTFKAELTSRDQEHLREPPAEGVFLSNLVLRGGLWEAPPGELREVHDGTPRPLPVVHVTYLSPLHVETLTPRQENALPSKQTVRLACLPCPDHGRGGPAGTQAAFELEVPIDGHSQPARFVLRGAHLLAKP